MKQRIIKTIFLILAIICFATGVFSLTHSHTLSNPISLFLAAITYLLTYITMSKPQAGYSNVIKALYIATFIIFISIAGISYFMNRNMLSVSSFLLCAITQIIGYRAFIKQNTV